MKKRKLLLSMVFVMTILSVVLLAGISNVKAKVMEDNVSVAVEDKNEQLECEKIFDEFSIGKRNVMERQYEGSVQIQKGISLYSMDEQSINTNPNNAYLVENDMKYKETMENQGEMRWYAFSVDSKSKVTILLQMVDTLDADLYMYSLNEETYQLSLIGGSANEGMGVQEYFCDLLDTGIYYFAVGGYEGTGDFAFAFYESSFDVQYEINDSLETAMEVSLNTDISGVIDSPYDVDCFSITVKKPTILRYDIPTPSGYVLGYLGKTGTFSSAVMIDGTMIEVQPGTYYFGVYSKSSSYSASKSYTVHFKKIGEFADEKVVPLRAICEEACVVFQTNVSGTKYYVNGNPIDISYEYKYSLSNTSGSQNYNITLKDNDGVYCQIWSEETQGPEVVYYLNSSKPYRNVGQKALLHLLFYGNPSKDFYNIECDGTGAYISDTLHQKPEYVIVLIDPDNGKLVDISEYNYFYQHIMGTNRISYYKPYTMTFEYSLFDYVN